MNYQICPKCQISEISCQEINSSFLNRYLCALLRMRYVILSNTVSLNSGHLVYIMYVYSLLKTLRGVRIIPHFRYSSLYSLMKMNFLSSGYTYVTHGVRILSSETLERCTYHLSFAVFIYHTFSRYTYTSCDVRTQS